MSAHQLHRMLGITYKTAWFMAMRIREAMRKGSLEPMGGKGQTVEVDETFYGKLKDVPQNKGFAHKNVVMGLVNRDTGEVRTFHIANTSMAETMPIVLHNIHKKSTIYTYEASHYRSLGQHFAKHDSVVHSREEYARGSSLNKSDRRLFLDLQARHAWHLPALWRASFARPSRGIRLPIQPSYQARL